jgi:alkyl hydroperoxide reductase subunit AhpC
MNQFAQLCDRVKDFKKRGAQVLFVLPDEPAYVRQWLRSRGRWATAVSDFLEEKAGKRPWLRFRGAGSEEPACPVLADPSYTTSADYGVAFQAFRWDSNWPTTFIIDRQGVLRFQERSVNTLDRPPVGRLLRAVDGLK